MWCVSSLVLGCGAFGSLLCPLGQRFSRLALDHAAPTHGGDALQSVPFVIGFDEFKPVGYVVDLLFDIGFLQSARRALGKPGDARAADGTVELGVVKCSAPDGDIKHLVAGKGLCGADGDAGFAPGADGRAVVEGVCLGDL